MEATHPALAWMEVPWGQGTLAAAMGDGGSYVSISIVHGETFVLPY